MTQGLSVSDIVNVQVDISPTAAPYFGFGNLLILGPSTVIDVSERLRLYSGGDTALAAIATDFGTSAPEYKAADLFFSQEPQPNQVYIGRWAQTATPGLLHGAILTASQAALSNFTPITSGAFEIRIDGVPYAIQGLDFSEALNLNGVASAIQAALPSGATCKWNSIYDRFTILSGTTGITSTVNYAKAPTAVGSIAFASNPATNDTITLNGSAITFKTSGPTGNQVLIGASLAATLTNLLTFLNTSTDTQIVKFSPSLNGTTLELASVASGTAGNTLTIAASAATPSGATLSGGTGSDVSAVLGLTQASGASAPVPGIAPEALIDCVTGLADKSNAWYGLTVAAATPPSISDHLAVAAFIEGAGLRIYGITTNDTSILDPTNTGDLCSQLMSLGYRRTFTQYCSTSPYAIASFIGRAFTVDFTAQNTVLTMKFKQEPGVIAETLTESQAATLNSKNCNVFVNYANQVAIVQQGVMADGFFFDEIQNLDWLANRVQTDIFNVLYQSTTKVPQTDAGIHLLVNAATTSCAAGVYNGTIAEGYWTGASFGALKQNSIIPGGFYIYVPPVAQQSQVDREARKAPTMQIGVKLAGAVHSSNVIINVNR